jgi:23S rRNA pseudouridine1911/1915/1917 synthase
MKSPNLVFENDDWLVLNKPPLWHSVWAAKNAEAPSIEAWIKDQRPSLSELPEAGLVHRLDWGTSGCLVIAKNRRSYERGRKAFQAAAIQKIYWALVESSPTVNHFDFYFSSRYRGSSKVTVSSKGKEAERGRCSWNALPQKAASSFVCLEIKLEGPGKRHQIRAGLAALGRPIIGDQIYGSTETWSEGFALHARSLSGLSEETWECEPPIPWDCSY